MVRASNRFYPNIMELSNAEFPPNRNVYFGVCPRQRMHVGKEHIAILRPSGQVWIWRPGGYSGLNSNFVDVKEAREAVKAFPLKPSIIVQSGRGFHLYWLLQSQKKIPDVEAVENLLRKLNDHFRCPSPVGIDSTLRLPGTWNPRGPKGPRNVLWNTWILRFAIIRLNFRIWISEKLRHPKSRVPRFFRGKEQSRTAPGLEISKSDKKLAPELERPDVQEELEQAKPNVSVEPRFLRKIVENNYEQGDNQTSLKKLADKDLDDLANKLADNLVQRITENLSNGHFDRIIDGLVEKLINRIFPGNNR